MKQKQRFNPQLDPARLLHQGRRCTSTVLDHRPLLLMMILRNHHLVRKTLIRKDGSFIDERAEAVVLEVEETIEEMTHDGSPLGDSQTTSTAATTHSRRFLLNQECIKIDAFVS
uniref:Uncharacterized protein n=1 Tax=Brassica campestris TaxID=3711 RepID=M4FFA0_BRACM